MLCSLLLPPLRGHGRILVACDELCSAKKAENPSSPSPSLCLPLVSPTLCQPTKTEEGYKEEAYTWTKQRVYFPPRLCSLNEFGVGMDSDHSRYDAHRDFSASLSAIVELSSQVQNWEVLSGRFAMMVFASALMLEALTGNSVFEKIDSHRLLEYCGAAFISVLIAAGCAVALQAKSHVAYTVSKGYERLIHGLVDQALDSLLFDDEEC